MDLLKRDLRSSIRLTSSRLHTDAVSQLPRPQERYFDCFKMVIIMCLMQILHHISITHLDASFKNP